MLSTDAGTNLFKDEVLLSVGQFDVKQMTLSWPKLLLLWEQIKRFRTLFSDLTRGDLENFVRYVTSPETLWLEICRGKELVGVVTCENMYKIVDIDAHVLFLDRNLAEKVPVCKATVLWLFDTFPIQRVTVQIPDMYYATVRLVKNIGFRVEGKKKQSVLIGGKWIDCYVFGMTRQEAMTKCHS